MIAKKYYDMSEPEKIANTVLLMGSDCVPIYEQFEFDETKPDKKKSLDNVLTMFTNHFEPVKNLIYERMKFNSIVQGDMPIHQFIIKLQSQADVCEYGTMKNELVRDRIVVGVKDKRLREYLIDIDDLDLAKCIQKAKQFVTHHEQSEKLAGSSSDPNLDAIRTQPSKPGVNRSSEPKPSNQKGLWKNCWYCKYGPHSRETCPARNAVCNACKLRGHWAKSKICKGKRFRSANEVTDEVEGLFLGSESE